MAKVKFEDEEVYRLLQKFHFNKTALARYYRVTLKTINAQLRRMQDRGYDIPPSKFDSTRVPPWNAESDMLLINWWNAGRPAKDIANELGMAITQIYSRARVFQLSRYNKSVRL